ncbi:hypothetical protein DL98DRAFT_584786 [Cadophora sp. DSE1049]|nr:hypothetical protein DL98DRAFT_584786 [Cadophora sp. DSE1049]
MPPEVPRKPQPTRPMGSTDRGSSLSGRLVLAKGRLEMQVEWGSSQREADTSKKANASPMDGMDNNQPVSLSAIGEANCPGGEDGAGNEAIPLGVLTWSDSSDGNKEPSADELQVQTRVPCELAQWLTLARVAAMLLCCSSPAFPSGIRSDPERTGMADMTDMTRSGASHACPV